MDLHRHDQYSTFDGFGKPSELAKIAREKGYTWLGISNHGTTAGNIQHYFACKEEGIKPIMGVECYHEPVFSEDKKERKSYHLCIFAKNLQGYENMNKIMTQAENNKYYVARVTFELLEKYKEGLIVTSACVASYPSQAIIEKKKKKAFAWLKKMKQIFDQDFYVEIQPYTITDIGKQEYINRELIKMADSLRIKCILTSDSHRGRKEDIETYLKMHQIAKHDSYDIEQTYSERYMPDRKDMYYRFLEMHEKGKYRVDFAEDRAAEFMINLENLAKKVDDNILDQIPLIMPVYDQNMTEKEISEKIRQEVKKGLKKRGKYNKQYALRCKKELEVIGSQGFNGYFLIVQDYVQYAKKKGIMVGPGRGSVCNCLVAYALGITEVDSIKFNLDFNRFMRHGKNKIPDIDLDFETERRIEVIQYMVQKYQGRAAQISSYGLYKIDNLLNDLFKVCGVEEERDKSAIKKYVKTDLNAIDELITLEEAQETISFDRINMEFEDILIHFYALYNKIRYYGTHAAGVAITAGEINKYTAMRKDKDGNWFCVHDLVDLEKIFVVKFDILGLKTLSIIKDLRKETGIEEFDEKWTEDKKVIEAFGQGNTDGVFQFDRAACQDILKKINTDCFEDIIAVNAMNRPTALKMHMPDRYADHKQNQNDLKYSLYWKYVSETYGCIIYQEQVLAISINIGGLTPDEADILVKMEKSSQSRTKTEITEKYYKKFKKKFMKNAIKKGIEKEEAADLYESMTEYGFNKGHSTGYSLMSVEECYYLVYHPAEYFYVKIKYAKDEAEQERFCAKAIVNDVVVFIPHINYSESKTCMRLYEGEKIIQKGLSTLKGVGDKAGEFIVNEREQQGRFKTFDDFYDRCKCRVVTSRVITILKEAGCCEIKHKTYMNRVKKYNRGLYMKGASK